MTISTEMATPPKSIYIWIHRVDSQQSIRFDSHMTISTEMATPPKSIYIWIHVVDSQQSIRFDSHMTISTEMATPPESIYMDSRSRFTTVDSLRFTYDNFH